MCSCCYVLSSTYNASPMRLSVLSVCNWKEQGGFKPLHWKPREESFGLNVYRHSKSETSLKFTLMETAFGSPSFRSPALSFSLDQRSSGGGGVPQPRQSLPFALEVLSTSSSQAAFPLRSHTLALPTRLHSSLKVPAHADLRSSCRLCCALGNSAELCS